MLYGLLLSLFILNCFLLVLIILIQQGKGSMGLGNLGGGAQMLFGGSGGQDIFQKITWVLGSLFMAGSLMLALMKSAQAPYSRYNSPRAPISSSAPALPSQTDEY
jgi:preprotein translocase subunit SecG